MLARALLVLLVVINLGVAAWWATHASQSPPAKIEAAPMGIPKLRLLQETGIARAEADDGTACYRFGPFGDADALAAARRRAEAFADDVRVVAVPGPASSAWRVVMPPLASMQASAAMAQRIVAAGFDDYLVVDDGAEAGSIALGRFSSAEAASRRRQALREAGFETQVHAVEGTANWLLFALPAGRAASEVRAALAALQANPVACAG